MCQYVRKNEEMKQQLKNGLFLDRIPNVSADSAVLHLFACTSNKYVVHTECITYASCCRPKPHYSQHSTQVIIANNV